MNWVIPLITALSIGSVAAALISWGIAIANHRQAWINALRDDIATYLKELEAMHYVIGDLLGGSGEEALEQKKRDARLSVLFVYSRILLRLNPTEETHNDLVKKLNDLMVIGKKVPDRAQIEETIDLVRRVLKREWAVTKYGPFTNMVLKVKAKCRARSNVG